MASAVLTGRSKSLARRRLRPGRATARTIVLSKLLSRIAAAPRQKEEAIDELRELAQQRRGNHNWLAPLDTFWAGL